MHKSIDCYAKGFMLQAALVKFSSFDIKEGSKMNTYSQFETVDTAAGQCWQMTIPVLQ